jgi:5-methylcytosine-specific restriction endonuclease McrA
MKDKKKAKADKLFSLFVRDRDGKCVFCGTTVRLQCAHIFSRRNMRLRHDPQNAITLCFKCHFRYMHYNSAEGIARFQNMYPKRWEYLLVAKNEIKKLTMKRY